MPSFGHWWVVFSCFVVVQVTATSTFNPLDFEKKAAQCRAIRRDVSDTVVDINIKYVDINPKAHTTIIMVHGWPSLWSTWSNQIQEFKEDYHLVVPDLRGFGESTHPGNPQTSGTMDDMVNDLICVLDHAKVSSATCMGHDWGSSICYEAARLRPDVFKAVIAAVIPYIPSTGPFIPIKELASAFPTLSYQIFFDSQPDAATTELDKDIRRTVRATLRTVDSPPPSTFLRSSTSFLAAWETVQEIPPVPFFTPEEENYFINQYKISGFRNTLEFYSQKNRLHHWRLANSQGNHTITQPVLAVYPTQDPVADWIAAAKMMKSADYLPNLTTKVLPGAHWLHLEHPKRFNAAVRKWLDSLHGQGAGMEKVFDEL